MAWDLAVAPRAAKDLDGLTSRDRKAVEDAITRLATDPGAGQLKKLGGPGNRWRRRVGDWRIILELDNAAGRINVLRVLPRNERTYRR